MIDQRLLRTDLDGANAALPGRNVPAIVADIDRVTRRISTPRRCNSVAARLPRHPNLLWSQLAADSLWAPLIADGHHVDRETLSPVAAWMTPTS